MRGIMYMNNQEKDILNKLFTEPYVNQRALSEMTGHSLGIVNRSISQLVKEGYINEEMHPTLKAKDYFERHKTKNAIILAAGFGMRMVPINMEVPKGLIEVGGETLIERIIKQLHERGIQEIYIVVGFMKEKYEYLIDKYGVELVVNPEYAKKNNMFSLKLVQQHLANSYIIPCDIWCDFNPFNKYELYSWYMVTNRMDDSSSVKVNRNMELIMIPKEDVGNSMVGIAYLTEDTAKIVCQTLELLCEDKGNDNEFWEKALYIKKKMIVAARVVQNDRVVEINTYEQLREIDENSDQLKVEAIDVICNALKVAPKDIKDITVLKKGMTNRSFLFSCKEKKYIMRIPGEGTDELINRKQEACVYKAIDKKNICDNIVYINPQNGYKITEFLEGVRVCNPVDIKDVKLCMKYLREFHEMKIKVEHEFDLFSKLEFYEDLWEGNPSVYSDYKQTKENVLSLKSYIDQHVEEKVLTHIDAVSDNFLFVKIDGKEQIRLIDWEYAGMQDPHVDIAMFGIYSLYNKEQMDQLIDAYFVEGCCKEVRIKIYCYIAVCGLLWSNWCEYKSKLGVEFGEYSLKQYRYAKEYYRIVQMELEELDNEKRRQ